MTGARHSSETMAERYLISKDNLAEGAAVPEVQKLKMERNAALAEEKRKTTDDKKKLRATQRHDLKMRTLKYDKEYSQHNKKLIALRRQAKSAGNFFVEPEPKLLFVMRIVGIIKMAPKPRKVMQLLRLRQLHNGVFLKVNKPILHMLKAVQPFVAYGYPSLKTTRELVYKRGFGKINKCRIALNDNEIVTQHLGEHGIFGIEDIIHELYTVGPAFKQVSNFLWPFKLSSPKGGFVCKRHAYNEQRGGDWGNREEMVNELISRMN